MLVIISSIVVLVPMIIMSIVISPVIRRMLINLTTLFRIIR